MIITPGELATIEKMIEQIIEDADSNNDWPDDPIQDPIFFSNNPHLLMPMGFDECHSVSRAEDGNYPVTDDLSFAYSDLCFDHEIFYRASSSGAWKFYEGIGRYSKAANDDDLSIHFVSPDNQHEYVSVEEYLSTLRHLVENPDPYPHLVVPPQLWTPATQKAQSLSISSVVPQLLNDIQQERTSLSDLSPRQLEELVAELLRSRGLDVFVTKQTRDGGRDIIAKGELIPGEPTILAVEVKQKDVVGLHDVQRALYANADFPVMLLATAGRFSAGVLREKREHQNQLRMFLKDGIALGQWISTYGAYKNRR